MKFSKKSAGLVLVVMALAACATSPKVSVLASAEQPVAAKTYAWEMVAPQSAAEQHPAIDNDIIRSRTEQAINAALAAKGYERVNDRSLAELLVAYRIGLRSGTETRVEERPSMRHPRIITCSRFGCGNAFDWGYYGPPEVSVREITYTEGGLMVDVKNRATNTLVWRALYKDRVRGTKDGTQEGLNAIASETLASLPLAGR